MIERPLYSRIKLWIVTIAMHYAGVIHGTCVGSCTGASTCTDVPACLAPPSLLRHWHMGCNMFGADTCNGMGDASMWMRALPSPCDQHVLRGRSHAESHKPYCDHYAPASSRLIS